MGNRLLGTRYSVLSTNSVRPALRPDLGEQNDRCVKIAGENAGFERLRALEIVTTGADAERETYSQHGLIEERRWNHARRTIGRPLPPRGGNPPRDVARPPHQRL